MKNKIKEEIISYINNLENGDLREKSLKEVELFESSFGLYDENNLECIYKKWKSGKKGDKNRINSWLAFALGITSKEPESNTVLKTRAYARQSLPDIDIDYDPYGVEQVIAYNKEKYGEDKVAQIITFQTLKTKASLTRVIKALDIADAFHKGKDRFVTENMEKVREIVDKIPKPQGSQLRGFDSKGNEIVVKKVEDAYNCFQEFRYYLDKYPEIKKHSSALEGISVNPSQHASGVVVSSEPLSEICPIRNTRKGPATQYAMEELESIGLIKFDFLKLMTLPVLKLCLELIEKNYGIKLDLEKIRTDDKKTLDLFKTGNLVGVFQCENDGMQETMRKIKVDHIRDIMAAIALYRPGPLEYIQDYCDRKNGLKKIDYFHPSIEKHVKPFLDKTYGIICYQEQIMQVCSALANFDMTEGYEMIKGIGKKKEEIINKFKERFVSGCVSNNIDKNIANPYWDNVIVPFSNYGFNLAHSAAYGLLSYYTGYLKANYTEEYMTALLNVYNKEGKNDDIILFEKDLKKFNIDLDSRNINTCEPDYKIVKKRDLSLGINRSVISPSLVVKGIGYETACEIFNKRPYADLKDFAKKTNSLVTKETVGYLVDAGFFEKYMKIQSKKENKKITKDIIVEDFSKYKKDSLQLSKHGIETEEII